MRKLILSCFVLTTIFSCGKDDCAKSDFIGTWAGKETCDLSSTEDITITITEGSGDNVIINGGQFIEEDVKVDGCKLEGGESFLGLGIKIEGELKDGTMTLSYDNDAGAISIGCDYSGLKKQ